jgi:phosphatidylglycerol:prolipoprotein diacylglycerol transferase
MYPSLYYFFKDIFGIDFQPLKMFQMFGCWVAIAFLVGGYFWTKELKRKEANGLLKPGNTKVLRGGKITTGEILSSALLGFLIGFKLVYIIFNFHAFVENTQGFLLSTQGSLVGGLLFAAGSVYLKYRDKEKERKVYETATWVEETVHPYQHVGNMTLIAAFAGLAGAKIFHNLENWDTFMADPLGAILSFDGLTMYGGLILASIVLIWYGKKNGLTTPHLIDSAAGPLMIGYGVGRIGCHMAGDGDWGILNSAYASNPDGSITTGTAEQFQTALQENQHFYINEFGSLDKVHHLSAHAPSWLPDWLYASTYPHNVVHNGIETSNCAGPYCEHLPIPVFPTPLYEVIMCIFLFIILWNIRKKITTPGVLFSIYLILNGIERFFIEKIRVNTLYNINGFRFTQAELISTILFFLGVAGIFYFKRLEKSKTEMKM